jgi:hypothetical protein
MREGVIAGRCVYIKKRKKKKERVCVLEGSLSRLLNLEHVCIAER